MTSAKCKELDSCPFLEEGETRNNHIDWLQSLESINVSTQKVGMLDFRLNVELIFWATSFPSGNSGHLFFSKPMKAFVGFPWNVKVLDEARQSGFPEFTSLPVYYFANHSLYEHVY